MATREPPVELYYDPADLDSEAPRLYVRRGGEAWALEDEAGTLLSTHRTQDDAIDAALERSAQRFSEILVRGSTGRMEWLIDQNPELLRVVDSLSRRWEKRAPEAAD
jgi:hypothetical protein